MPRVVYEEQVIYKDRTEAGRLLADRLTQFRGANAVALAVPRGGVPVAMEIAEALNLPLDIVLPRKIAVPYDPGSGYGAITEDGTTVLNELLMKQLELTETQVQEQVTAVREDIVRRCASYRNSLAEVDLGGKTAIIVDDGLASGYTMIAAIKSLRQRHASSIIVAVPVASGTAYDLVRANVDKLVCLVVARIHGVVINRFYQKNYDAPDESFIQLLAEWQSRQQKA